MSIEFFPAVQGKLGSWRYYSTRMRARQLATRVQFASEVYSQTSLDDMLQRVLNHNRSKEQIARYIAGHEDRFFNAIVVAAIDGAPKFRGIQLQGEDSFLEMFSNTTIDGAFGILAFDEQVKYYALDGQHRLKAIKALLDNETQFTCPVGFEEEEFPVIIVVQREAESKQSFLKKYRRLFGHLNRNAKPMDEQTKIAIDEDDAFAILTRRLLQEHSFFRVKRAGKSPIRAIGSVNVQPDEDIFTTLKTLYDMNVELLSTSEVLKTFKDLQSFRPDDDKLDTMYSHLSAIWDVIAENVAFLGCNPASMRSSSDKIESCDDQQTLAHAWFRPLTQVILAKIVRRILNQRLASPSIDSPAQVDDVRSALRGLSSLPYQLGSAPYRRLVYIQNNDGDDERDWKMRSEDRRMAQDKLLGVFDFIANTTHWDAASLPTLRASWEDGLYEADSTERDEMWAAIEQSARLYREAIG